MEDGAEIVEPGIDQLQAELHRAVVGRGTVWFNVKVDKIDPQTGVGELDDRLSTAARHRDRK